MMIICAFYFIHTIFVKFIFITRINSFFYGSHNFQLSCEILEVKTKEFAERI